MTLEELLEYTGKELLDDRTEMISGDPDERWTDTLLVRLFNEAENLLCRKAWALIDTGHVQAGRLVLITDQPAYTLHTKVLVVREAYVDGVDEPLRRYTEKELRSPQPYCEDTGYVPSSSNVSAGATIGYATDAGTKKLRVFRTPSSVENGTLLLLKVVRLPITPLTLDNTDASPEVAEQWHAYLAKYAAGKCLRDATSATPEQRAAGKEYLEEWNEAIRDANRERRRAEAKPDRWVLQSTTAHL